MKRYNQWGTYLLLMIGIMVLGTSCNKKLDIVAVNVGSEEKEWTSISDTRAHLMGIYGLMRAAMVDNYGHWVYGEMRYGDFKSYSRADLKAVEENKLKSAYPMIKGLTDWRRFYAVINAASLFIERAPEVMEKDSRYTERDLKYDVAQAKSIRALMYFYMVRIWGEVPLLKASYDNDSFAEVGKATEATVLAFAEAELLAAAQDLPYRYALGTQSYYGESYSTWVGVLFNKITAYSLLAHIAAWQGKYINADVYSKFVIDNQAESILELLSVPNLVNPTTGLFGPSIRGQILAVRASYELGEATNTGHIESLTLGFPIVTKAKPDIFVNRDSINVVFDDVSDTRFGIDSISGLIRTNYFTNYDGDIPIFSKIKVIRNGDGDSDFSIFGSNLVFTRLEEIYLLHAEAKAVLGQKDESIKYLNLIKNQRGLKPYINSSSKDLLEEIFLERRRELMGEGWRWFDQIRLAKIKKNNDTLNSLIANGGIYWPISSDVLERNSKLEQNSYWK
ncbi:starch-binding protein [Sphingobacterium sp. ML3W]|uniref:RagB/SusD family nutrient uptake outer membrane protein n=1 Tax=Sphingobacterium TaxID=28453 RepID=UPI0004F5D8AF|nr:MULTISPECIES: RagB/SusD family nutrient uptake outer membrane protein [Sphingobacterium]AIM35708.1 starch-binding protein [Sphingobacterium sp. ML3W]MDH5828168.1 RagB/SusD family nutrient uptake outer membrane protein [Sphingobacterium faecium]